MADIHHIGIRVRNLDETVRVFVEAFNVEVVPDTTRPGEIRIAYAHFGNARLELIEDPQLADESTPTATLDHFAVESNDIRADMANLAAHGFASRDSAPRTAAFGNAVAAFELETFAGVKLHLVSEHDVN